MKTVQIVSLPKGSHILCSSPKCDGRPARWYFPQAPSSAQPQRQFRSVIHRSGFLRACGVHLSAIARIVETWHVTDIPVSEDTGCANVGEAL